MTALVPPVVPQQPNLPGYIDGVIALAPLTLQCRTCGDVTANHGEVETRSDGAFVILSGFRFHGCDGPEGKRQCPDCLSATIQSCPSKRCKS